MPSRPRKPDQKERIRRKAAQLFAKNSYHGTGVQELGEAVGLGRGALYHHIGSKEALLEDIATRHVKAVTHYGEELLAQDLSAEEKLRRLSRVQMRTLADHLPDMIVATRDVPTVRAPLRRRIVAWRDRFEAVWVAIVDQGVAAGEFRPLDPVAVKGILGMHNFGYMWVRPQGRLAPEEIADVFCDIVLGGIRAERYAPRRAQVR